jgi:hypothetical protein
MGPFLGITFIFLPAVLCLESFINRYTITSLFPHNAEELCRIPKEAFSVELAEKFSPDEFLLSQTFGKLWGVG